MAAWAGLGGSVSYAQTPTLEFAANAGNPTGNGPSVANQVITFQNNTNNPTDNAFTAYTPTTTATFVLSNQQYSQPTNVLSTGSVVAFGATVNSGNGNIAAPASALFPLMNAFGTPSNANFTSVNGVSGGIDVAVNRGVELFVSAMPLPATAPANARYQVADLTINFNRAIIDPVIHVAGLGGNYGGGIGFTTEFDLITTGVTASKLSGSTELSVTPNQILNNAANPNAGTGAGAATGSILVTTPASGISSLVLRVYLRPDSDGGPLHATDGSAGHVGDGLTIGVSTRSAISPINGTVFEDVNYGGGAGRPRTATGASVRSGARVELYSPTGAFLSATTTNAAGQYSFAAPASLGNYIVRVVNSTVTSSRTGYTTALSAVQTYNGEADNVGGEDPSKTDAPQNITNLNISALNTPLTIAQSQGIATVAVGATAAVVDFGFNFSTVVNTNDTGQGSLRQFILNSNALTNTGLDQAPFNGTVAAGTTGTDPAAGVETSIFMLSDGRATGAPAGLRDGLPAVAGYNASTGFTFTLASALPNITDTNTALDGNKQANLTGNKVAAVAEVTTGPEVTINFGGFKGLEATANNTQVASVNLTNAGGTAANGFAVYLNTSANSTVTDITATGNSFGGVRLNNADGASVTNNVFLGSASQNANADGIQVLGGTINATITGNTISNNRNNGIEFTSGTNTGSTVSNNTVRNNAAGIVILVGNTNTFRSNTITGNTGDGITAASGTISGTTGNLFTRNSTSGNGNLGIDLSATTTGTGDDISLNASGKTAASGANGLLNFPVLTQATVTNTTNGNFIISGYAPAGSTVELFLSDRTTDGFGQGRTYLFSFLEGGSMTGALNNTNAAVSDADSKTSSYSSSMNGLNQGSETNASRFYITIPLSTLSNAQVAALTTGTVRLTATATTSGTTTSEFSGTVQVSQNRPLPVTLTSFTAQAAGRDAILTWATAQEVNNDSFVVERSLDGTRFETVSVVAGQGTKATASSYRFVDARIAAKAAGQLVYYRLRQLDTDGTQSLTTVQVVRFTANGQPTAGLYPTTVTATTDAQLDLTALPQGVYQVSITDMTGRMVRSFEQAGGSSAALHTTSLMNGTYLVQIKSQQQVLVKRFVKE